MAIGTQSTRTRNVASKKNVVGRKAADNFTLSARAKKAGFSHVGNDWYLGDVKLTATNFPLIMNELKGLKRMIVGGTRRSIAH